MKTLIIHGSTYGISKKISAKLREDLGGDVTLLNLRQDKVPPLENYHRIIIGSSVKTGKLEKAVYKFCTNHIDELRETVLGLFVCSNEANELDARQNLEAFPEQLLFAARSTAVFKERFDNETSGFINRLLSRNLNRKKYRPIIVDSEAIQQFSQRMDRIFNPFLFLV